MGFLSRHPLAVIVSVLIAWGAAAWFVTDYIENIVRPRQQQARLNLIEDQIAQAHRLFKRGDYEAALQEYQYIQSAYVDDLPDSTQGALYDWIGRCDMAIADSKDSEDHYSRAIESFDQALNYRTPNKELADHVATALQRGQAQQALAVLRSDERGVIQAVSTYQETLAKIAAENMPAQRSAIHRFLGNAQRVLYQMDQERFKMQPALERYQAALDAVVALEHPDAYAEGLQELGRAYVILAERKYRRRYLETAVEYFEESLEYYDSERAPKKHARVQLLIGDTYALLAATKPKNRSDRAAHQQRIIRYQNKAKKAYQIAQGLGLTAGHRRAVDSKKQ